MERHCFLNKEYVVEVCCVDTHVHKSWATEEQQNNHQVDQAGRIKVAQIDFYWQHKCELFLAQWAHEILGHHGRDATYKWARDQGVDISMDIIDCDTCTTVKQAKRM